MEKLSGKKVLITGGSSGIGKATAKMLTSKGAIVCITGRDKHKLDNVASELNAIPIHLDVSKYNHEKKYDFILVNINRNTIIEEFKYFLKVVKNKSVLILSGFLYSDVNYISDFLKNSGLKIINSKKENDWVVLVVKK